jgi:hypothetical protein
LRGGLARARHEHMLLATCHFSYQLEARQGRGRIKVGLGWDEG